MDAPPAMLTIGRLGRLAGVGTKTLRYYDHLGLVPPASRSPGGYRLYTPQTLARLEFIRRAKALGIALADIRRILAVRDEGRPPCAHVAALVSANLARVEAQLAHLERLRRDLRRLQWRLRRAVPAEPRSAEDCPCFALIQHPPTSRPGQHRRRDRAGRTSGRGRRSGQAGGQRADG